VGVAFLPPGVFSIDGRSMIAVAESLAAGGGLSVPPALGRPGPDGLFYSRWYPLLSLLAVPLVALGRALAGALGVPPHFAAAVAALVLSVALAAAATWYVARLAERLGAGPREALLAALAYALGTPALVHARTFYADPLLALLTVAALYHSAGPAAAERRAVVVASGLAVLAKPSGVLVGAALSAAALVHRRWRAAWPPIAAAVIGVLVYLAYNQLRFGNPRTFGHDWEFDLTAVPIDVAGLLVSPGQGIVWFAPPVMLGVALLPAVFRHDRRTGLAITLYALGTVALYAAWPRWYLGASGPRFLLPALPGLVAASGLVGRRARRLLIALTLLGFVANAPSLLVFGERYYTEAEARGRTVDRLLWTVDEWPVIEMWRTAWRTVVEARGTDVRALMREAGVAHDGPARPFRVVAIWWWMLPALGLPRWPGAALSAAALGAAGFLVARALKADAV